MCGGMRRHDSVSWRVKLMPDADIIVVGAGPAGSATAALAARAGARVLLLDRARFPRNKACAEYMSPGVLQALCRMGLSDGVLERRPLQVPGMEIVAPSGFRYRLRYEQAGRSLNAITLPRLQLDHALVESAVRSSARLEEGVTVREALLDDGVVRGVVASRDGRRVRICGSMVVVADGSRSMLRRGLGLDAPVRWPNRMGLVAHFDGASGLQGGFGQMHVADGGYCGLAPLPGGGTNVGLVIHFRRGRKSAIPASQIMDDWIARHPLLSRALSGCRRASPVRGMAPVGARARAVAGRGFLVTGDAAGFFDPFTGEGIHRALMGGEIAAGTALKALGDGFGASEIGAYARRRRAAFRKKEVVTCLVQTFVTFPRLLEYALPRLDARPSSADLLSAVLGDIADPGRFLRPGPLWETLRP